MKRRGQPTSVKVADRSKEKIDSLVLALRSKDGMKRQRARQALVNTGRTVTPRLIPLLRDRQEQVRWETCKALTDIADPTCAPALIGVLEDESFDVRWVAAETLIALGHPALVLLVQALIERPESIWLREGAHHILHAQNDPEVKAVIAPLLKVLNGFEMKDMVGLVAERTLKKLS
jgi:HEAT repeat protein